MATTQPAETDTGIYYVNGVRFGYKRGPYKAHKRGCLHCAKVRDYRLAREAAELAREAATGMYATEMAAYGPLITFRDWLEQTAAPTEQEEWSS